MPRTKATKHIDYRRRFTSPYFITSIELIGENWGCLSAQEVITKLIVDGIINEKERIKQRELNLNKLLGK